MRLIVIIIFWLISLFSYHKETILIVQFKGVDDSIALGVSKNIKKTFKVRVEIMKLGELPDSSFNPYVNEYNALMLLHYLDNHFIGDKVIGLTSQPLVVFNHYSWSGNDVYGYGDEPGQSCIISSNLLDSNKIVSELGILANHELGHTYGLGHCDNDSCYMTRGNGYTNSFASCQHFCKTCSKKLKRLRYEIKDSDW